LALLTALWAAGSVADMRARLLYRNRKRLTSGVIVEEVIWKLPQPEPDRPHGYKYRLAYVREGRRLIGYDNERGKGDHRHDGEHEEEYRFMSIEQLLDDFRADVMREEEKR
jgi:hypothetical protein